MHKSNPPEGVYSFKEDYCYVAPNDYLLPKLLESSRNKINDTDDIVIQNNNSLGSNTILVNSNAVNKKETKKAINIKIDFMIDLF